MQAKSDIRNPGKVSKLYQPENRRRGIELKSEHKADVMPLPHLPHRSGFTAVIDSSESESTTRDSVRMMDFQELERKRIYRELHDGLGQLLTSIKLRVQQCVTELEKSGKVEALGDTWDSMEQIPTLVTEAIQEVRSICSALRPAMLDDLGVLAAISWQCRQCRETMPRLKTEVDFFVEESEIPEFYKTNLYRIVQEALNNAVKYSEADVLRVGMRKEQGTLYLNIEDNGKGFSYDDTGARFSSMGVAGFGLTSMRERAESLGGTLIIESNENIGTNVQVALPLESQKDQ